MKQCVKCSMPLPNWIKVDGKIHNISSRKYCLNCSPFKKHNTKSLDGNPNRPIINNVIHRICSICQKTKPENGDYYTKRNRGDYHSRCKICMATATREKKQSLKKQAVEHLGGKCIVCGYERYYGSLDCHHNDPQKKEFTISHSNFYKFSQIKDELDKCFLICKNCHGELHAGIISL